MLTTKNYFMILKKNVINVESAIKNPIPLSQKNTTSTSTIFLL